MYKSQTKQKEPGRAGHQSSARIKVDEERQSRGQHSIHCRCSLTVMAALRIIPPITVSANPFTLITATSNRLLASKRKRQLAVTVECNNDENIYVDPYT